MNTPDNLGQVQVDICTICPSLKRKRDRGIADAFLGRNSQKSLKDNPDRITDFNILEGDDPYDLKCPLYELKKLKRDLKAADAVSFDISDRDPLDEAEMFEKSVKKLLYI